jgi:hypothetical protein
VIVVRFVAIQERSNQMKMAAAIHCFIPPYCVAALSCSSGLRNQAQEWHG